MERPVNWNGAIAKTPHSSSKREHYRHTADLPLHPESNGNTGDDIGRGSGRGSTTSTPSWVYVFGIVFVVLVLLFVILHLTGGGLGLHTPP